MESKAAALLVLVSALLAACIAGGEAQAARLTLIEFFDHLASDEYDQAADLYGGDYRQLIVFGPQIDPENRPELWRNACNFSGLQCLQVRSTALKAQAANILTFTVEFKNADGSLFVLGPCCGATPAEMPHTAQFDVRLRRTEQGTFEVLDLPPYLP